MVPSCHLLPSKCSHVSAIGLFPSPCIYYASSIEYCSGNNYVQLSQNSACVGLGIFKQLFNVFCPSLGRDTWTPGACHLQYNTAATGAPGMSSAPGQATSPQARVALAQRGLGRGRLSSSLRENQETRQPKRHGVKWCQKPFPVLEQPAKPDSEPRLGMSSAKEKCMWLRP